MNLLQAYLPLATQALAYVLPFAGLVLPGLLKKDSLSAVLNAVIAGFVTLVVSALQAYCAGKLGLNPIADFLAVSAGILALLNGPLKPLDQYIQSNIGNGASEVSTLSVTQKRASVVAPRPIALGTNAAVPTPIRRTTLTSNNNTDIEG